LQPFDSCFGKVQIHHNSNFDLANNIGLANVALFLDFISELVVCEVMDHLSWYGRSLTPDIHVDIASRSDTSKYTVSMNDAEIIALDVVDPGLVFLSQVSRHFPTPDAESLRGLMSNRPADLTFASLN